MLGTPKMGGKGFALTAARPWVLSPIRQSYDESLMAGKDRLRPCSGSFLKCPSNKGPASRNPTGFWPGKKTAKTIRASLYALISTLDLDQQTLSTQIRSRREYAARRGWTINLQMK